MSASPALFIAAPASGQGKTTFTAALARYHRNQGRQVRVFKTGPDFLDPMIHEVASGHPVFQLDLWLCGEAECRRRLHEASLEADLILIEGVMGLFDGSPSSADLAQAFGIPIAALIDASAMAQTFGAIAHGLKHYRPEIPFAGVIANRVASPGHAEMLRESMGDIPLLATLMRDEAITLPHRHLGLVQAGELDDLEQRLDKAAELIADTPLAQLPDAVEFMPQPSPPLEQTLRGLRIAIARDLAFAFIYPANLEILKSLGAELKFFSPLSEQQLPECDAVWLPGGYPELHLEALANNTAMKSALHQHVAANKPLLAECGGMLYLLEELDERAMLGLLPGSAVMQTKLAGLGMQSAPLPEGALTAHTFHHSRMEGGLEPIARGVRQRGGSPGEAIFRHGPITASYLHLYFPSNPEAIARLFSGENRC